MLLSFRRGSQPVEMQHGLNGDSWCQGFLHTPEEMTSAIESILTMMAQGGFGDKDLFSARLALEEAIVNALKHGNNNDPAKAVQVRYQVNPEQILVEIEDEGPGFDPDRIPDPLAPENIERPSGRGLFLIRYYMTWIKFNERGNCLTLCKVKSSLDTNDREIT